MVVAAAGMGATITEAVTITAVVGMAEHGMAAGGMAAALIGMAATTAD